MADEREVTIRLKVVIDQQGKAGLAQLKTAAEQAGAASQKAAEQAGVAASRAHRASHAAMLQMREATSMALGGVIQLGRGFALLGIVGEKDTKKLLEGLIKIQAAFDLLRGGMAIVVGLSKGWRAYEVSVTAAAAAHTALAAAQTAGGAAAAAGAGGAAAAGAGAA
ncbi:MAG: hypothetical protein IMZ55_05615, partial [Acidobacteria bacterium]|nr:hypothetical protein [Acidobacteriota bacterium]